MVKPNGLLVPVSSTHCCAYTSGLSTSSSSTALQKVLKPWEDLILRKVSRLYAFSAYPDRTSLPSGALVEQLDHKRFVQLGPLVLEPGPLKFPPPTADRDRTVSRRSEPSSRTALIGEQPNPWELLHPQDAMSRHRGAKPERRCELLTPISLLSPAYLLSVERWPFHTEPPDH